MINRLLREADGRYGGTDWRWDREGKRTGEILREQERGEGEQMEGMVGDRRGKRTRVSQTTSA